MKIKRITALGSITLAGLALLVASPATAQLTHNSDVRIIGSLDVGLDSTGTGFGFDTLRLKENNLRIKFDDTSSSASFPNNDWQLTANDSANGGLNHFSIDDITGGKTPFRVEAGAPTNTLYVEADGDVGVGTSNPVTRMHLVSGNTPTLRLEQDGSSGFTPQTWDVAGNEANFFVRDVTMGSKLPFRIKPGAPTDSLFVDPDGNVGMGTNSPAVNLHVQSAATNFLQIDSTAASIVGMFMDNTAGGGYSFQVNATGDFQVTEDGSGGAEFSIDSDAAGSTPKFLFNDGATALMEIEADGDVQNATGVFAIFSDRNKKTDVQPVDVEMVLAEVAAMPINTWRYKTNSEEMHMGPMAQDFWAAFGLHEGPRSLALNDLAGVALAAIQGLNETVQALNEVVEAKDAAFEGLMARMAALEAGQAVR